MPNRFAHQIVGGTLGAKFFKDQKAPLQLWREEVWREEERRRNEGDGVAAIRKSDGYESSPSGSPLRSCPNWAKQWFLGEKQRNIVISESKTLFSRVSPQRVA